MKKTKKSKLSSSAAKLYFFLIYQANKLFWEGPLTYSIRYLSKSLSLNKNTVIKSLKELYERKLITYYPPSEYYQRAIPTSIWFPQTTSKPKKTKKRGEKNLLNTQPPKKTNTSTISNYDCFCIKPLNCPVQGIMKESYCEKYANYLKAITYFNDVVPKIYYDVSFNNFAPHTETLKIALKKARFFVENKLWQKGNGLLMYGRYGTGKTRLGYTILKEIAIMGGIIGVIDVLHDFETFEQADEAVKTALKSNIIFIDDLGAKEHKWIDDKIRIIIDEINRSQKA